MHDTLLTQVSCVPSTCPHHRNVVAAFVADSALARVLAALCHLMTRYGSLEGLNSDLCPAPPPRPSCVCVGGGGVKGHPHTPELLREGILGCQMQKNNMCLSVGQFLSFTGTAPPMVSGLKGQRKMSSINAEETCDRRPKRTAKLRAGLPIGRRGWRGVGRLGEGGGGAGGWAYRAFK